jgi:hypothetical protein
VVFNGLGANHNFKNLMVELRSGIKSGIQSHKEWIIGKQVGHFQAWDSEVLFPDWLNAMGQVFLGKREFSLKLS